MSTVLIDKETTQPKQKLHKLLATLGLASRRTIEQWIQAGRITCNGITAQLGLYASTNDLITLDGQLINLTPLKIDYTKKLLLYYKPNSEICSTKDSQGRRTVFNSLPPLRQQRWVMIGRLDLNSEGLLLFTSDGLLSHRLLHPRYEIEREYAARVYGHVTPKIIKNLKNGVFLDGKIACFSSIESKASPGHSNQWYHVSLKEGRNREVRRLWLTQGVIVNRLIRIRFGPIRLPKTLKPGQFTWLESDVIQRLQGLVGL